MDVATFETLLILDLSLELWYALEAVILMYILCKFSAMCSESCNLHGSCRVLCDVEDKCTKPTSEGVESIHQQLLPDLCNMTLKLYS